ncbi:MAG: DnaJ C-terminal domain-containing protein [Hyphomicrobiales bacterium]
MEYRDYYKTLGVERTASADDIKAAYRKLARKYHPDISKEAGAEAKFKEVSEAYEVLKDAEKRAAYDQLGQGPQPGQTFRPPPGWDAGFEYEGAEEPGYSDFFEQLFGRARRQRPGGSGGGSFRASGGDHHAKILINLDDSYTGATRQVSLRNAEIDDKGQVQMKERTVNVTIPKGIREGQVIRLQGQGGPGIGGGASGDLYLEVEFAPDPLYKVDGKDVTYELPVAPWEAALGGKVKAPTPTGAVDLTIPPGSGTGRKLRLKGRGLPAAEPGDLYAVLKLVLPPNKGPEAERLYKEMAEKLAFNPRAGLGV